MAVVFVVGGFLLLNTIGYWLATAIGIRVPDGMDTLIGTALGYMGGILTSTKGTSNPQDVNVTNPKSHPVPVESED
jgi:hypothetical protein